MILLVRILLISFLFNRHFFLGLYRCNTINIWDYITKINRECARFYNFLYSPSNDSCVLRPSYKMYSLDIWDFYLSETLETGCPYDLDIALAEHDEHLNDAELKQRSKCISAIYDDISICLPDFFNEIVYVRMIDQLNIFNSYLLLFLYFQRKCQIH